MAESTPYTKSMNRLIDALGRLPGIGGRTAERLAFHLLKAEREEALELARAIEEVKERVSYCSRCFNLTDADPCPICRDAERDRRKILVVEQPRDVVSLEQAQSYDGVYHVLLGRIAPLEGVGAEALTIDALVDRIRSLADAGEPVEVILGINPTMEGEGTALEIARRLRGMPQVQLNRLARGLPAGTELQYANKQVLSDAISSRQPVE